MPQPAPEAPVSNLTDFDDVLFSPTDYPSEPLTEGASFGPGANFLRQGPEKEDDFLKRMALEVANTPNASSEVKSFATRVAKGE